MPQPITGDSPEHKILKNAMGLFAQKGYQGLSMRQLAKALHMTTGGLYHHFKSKDDLYVHMVNLLATQDAQALYEAIGTSPSSEETVRRFTQFLEMRVAYFQQLLLLVFDHQRYIRDPGQQPEARFIHVFEPTLTVYLHALNDALGLHSPPAAERLLDYLIGCLTRAMMRQCPPDFSQLSVFLQPSPCSHKPYCSEARP